MTPLAHGVGSRADLPLPLSLVVIGGGLALVISFVALVALWRSPRLADAGKGRLLPARVQQLLDSTALLVLGRAVVLALTLLVVAVAWWGPEALESNLAPWVLYVTFWVGLVPVSLLLGPVWARWNPLRTLHVLLIRPWAGEGRAPELLERMGRYPAAVALVAFAWLELAAPERGSPRKVALFLLLYAAVQLYAAAYFGDRWFARGDGFEVYSRLLGSLSPWGRRPQDQRWVLRNPLRGALALPQLPGTWAVVTVLVGSTAFDGVTRTTWWQDGGYEESAGPATLGLAAVVALVALLYLGACAVVRTLGEPSGAADRYAASLIPIAAGYAIAHYFSLFVLDGQTTWILASDPFGRGANLFGTAGQVVDYGVLTPRAISLVQVAAIVVGHVLGLVVAHERAVALEGATAVRRQLPMLVVMIVLTGCGLGLLLGT